MITVGNTFLVPSGPEGNHLFFVVIGPINIEGEPPGQFLLVNATSNSNDTACIIQPNDHHSSSMKAISHTDTLEWKQQQIFREK